jgi:hypothetical protein
MHDRHTVTVCQTGVFQIHNPARHWKAMLSDALTRNYLT